MLKYIATVDEPPQLAVVGKIQLAEVPQFESFYTVPLIAIFNS